MRGFQYFSTFRFILLLLVPFSASAQTTYSDFKSKVRQLVTNGELQLIEPWFDFDSPELLYFLRPSMFAQPGGDPLEFVLAEQLIVEAIIKYRISNPRQREFWPPVLRTVQERIETM